LPRLCPCHAPRPAVPWHSALQGRADFRVLVLMGRHSLRHQLNRPRWPRGGPRGTGSSMWRLDQVPADPCRAGPDRRR
jgi:hypothetical protein